MKNLFKIFVLSLLVFAVGCENEDDPRFQDNPETGWIEFSRASTTVAVTAGTTEITVPVDFTAPINLSDVVVSYAISPVTGNPSDVVTGIGTSITIVGNTNRALITMAPTADAISQLIANGDVVFDINLSSANRGIGIGLSDGSATVSHRVNLLCGGSPAPGTYTIDMHDSWGDGWQTTASGGGDGLTLTLVDTNGGETVFEFGMCSSFGTPTGFLGGTDCTGAGGFDATATIDVPAGTVDGVWNFPGDWFGEISFEIYTPDGSLLYASGGPGDQAAGEIAVSYCN